MLRNSANWRVSVGHSLRDIPSRFLSIVASSVLVTDAKKLGHNVDRCQHPPPITHDNPHKVTLGAKCLLGSEAQYLFVTKPCRMFSNVWSAEVRSLRSRSVATIAEFGSRTLRPQRSRLS